MTRVLDECTVMWRRTQLRFCLMVSLHLSVVFKVGIIHNSKALSLIVNFEDQMIDRIPQVHSSRIGRSLIDADICSTVFGFDTKSIG